MPGIYDITDKTYIRPADMIEELASSSTEAAFGKYVGEFSGMTWNVPHLLRSTNLLIGIWKYDPSNTASYWNISQIDYENLQIDWTAPVDGKVVIYSVRPYVGVAIVYDQTTPATTWTITHNFGTTDVIYTCWTSGTIITPVSAQTLDDNTVELTFAFPVTGTCVMILADPEINPSLHVDWANIYNLPSGFPPAPHTHDVSEIIGDGLNITTFQGYEVDDFVLESEIGEKVAPLQPKIGTLPVEYELPPEYLPNNLPYLFGDSDGVTKVVKVIAVSTGEHPLFVTKDPVTQEAFLDIHPVLSKLALTGNIIFNPSVSDSTVKVDTNYKMTLDVGAGLTATATNNNTIKIALSSGAGAVFTRAIFNPGDVWTITDSVFNLQGNYTLGLYETDMTPTAVLSGATNHVPVTTPPITDINVVFDVKGDEILELTSGKTTQEAVDFTDDHFVWNDHIPTLISGSPYTAPDNTDAVYWDTSDNTYIFRIPTSVGWTYRKLDPLSLSTYIFGIVMTASTFEHTAISGGYIYAIVPAMGSSFEVHRAVLSGIPLWSWSLYTAFPTEAMPTTTPGGKLRFRVQGDYLYLLNTSLNSFSVYQFSSATRLWIKALPQVVKDFDLWPDGYASFAIDGEDSLWVSDRPVNDLAFTVRKSRDLNMGDCSIFALTDDGNGALGVVPPNVIRRATHSYMSPITVYKTGETIIWLRGSYAWQVPLTWGQVLSMLWEAYDINPSAYDDVRIGFFPGSEPTLPTTLYRWTGTTFTPFPSADISTLGQPITAVNTIQQVTGEQLSYAIYIKKSAAKALNRGYITHNFNVTYRNAGLMYPVPIGGPFNNTDHIEVHCGTGILTVINTLGRTLNGVRLVATAAV